MQYSKYPGALDLWVFNSVGEHILTLEERPLSGPVSLNYVWDGRNKHGEMCASGVYLLYLVEPFDRKTRKIVLVH